MRLNWKSSWILGVVVLMLLAAYFLQGLEDGDGGSAPDVPGSELTPATLGPSPSASLTSSAGTSNRPAATASDARDLRADEARGGHTVARHVGKSDDELRTRLKAEPDISAASTYTDYQTAARAVQRVLDAKRSEIKKWEERTGSRPNLALRMGLGEIVGRSVAQGESQAVDAKAVTVVLRWDGSGWYVLTSYPEER